MGSLTKEAAEMAKEKKLNPAYQNPYYKKMHSVGRWMTVVAVAIFVGVPLITCLHFGIMPKFSDVMLASGGLCAIFIPVSIAESIAETPLMGSSYYLTCITGNVLNLKLPATLNALKITNPKQGTEAADAVTGVAVAVASLVTMTMIFIGVLLLAPLKPMLGSAAVQTAAQYVLPALFGCLVLTMFVPDVGGGVRIYGRLKAAIVPFIAALVLFFIIPKYYEVVEGFVMIIFIPIIYVTTKKMYHKGMIKVVLPEDDEAADAEVK